MSTVAEALAAQEFLSEVDDTDMVADALVVMRLVDKETGSVSVFFSKTAQSDIITVLGLATALGQMVDEGEWCHTGEDDDYGD